LVDPRLLIIGLVGHLVVGHPERRLNKAETLPNRITAVLMAMEIYLIYQST
jgi:hypothetical protein